ncbi:ArsR/SmtB family transcription factor [Glycomyces harbinensis]|uniref:Regulatory protein, arsR family n=1 Tax=Glycomyces harbinensis TaxID=58114 RepID=A0A1G6SCA8_9ACTN|nr:winged helix-turn-helix domain-containing protein [Glycomyces harbinensis]SDD14499.1 regulatory protein, arsR family [Glycomyces harbinensis]
MPSEDTAAGALTGEALLAACSALANPHRLRILGALADGRQYVSLLARQLGMSRPLLHMHLQKLQAAGLVTGELELSEDGKAVKYFESVPFALEITPQVVKAALSTLPETADRTTTETEKEAK